MAELSPAAQAVFYATHKAMAEQQFALSGVPDYRQVFPPPPFALLQNRSTTIGQHSTALMP